MSERNECPSERIAIDGVAMRCGTMRWRARSVSNYKCYLDLN